MEELKSLVHSKVTETLEETLENMAFISIEECSKEEASELEQDFLGVNLLVTEPALFEIHLNISKELLFQLAENMYAMDRDELDEQLIKDLLAEILNTSAGLFMTAILPPEKHFTLGLPELTDGISNNNDDAELKFYYIAEDCPLTVEIMAADTDSLKSLFNN